MNENIRLVVCDLDGTLITSDRKLTAKTKKTIETLHAHGVYFGLASGRSVDQQLINFAKDWGFDFEFDVLIGMNGSELWDAIHKKRYDFYPLKKEWIKEIIEMMEPFDLNPFLYYQGKMLCKKIDDSSLRSAKNNHIKLQVANDISEFFAEDNAKIMFRIPEEQMAEIEHYVNQHPSPHYKAFKTQTTMLEFTDRRVSKDIALKHFCEINHIPLSHVVAFGDINNDNEMLQCSGWGVCLLNGSDETKALANDVTEKSNDEDGFALYMEEHYFKKKRMVNITNN